MPTIPDHRPRRESQPSRHRRRARRRDPMLLVWPFGLLMLLALLALWRSEATPSTPVVDAPAPQRTTTRRLGDLRLDVPAGWVTLDRSADHVTWGAPDRAHTVTLAGTQSSLLPLPGVVSAVVRESADALPGARPVGRPRMLELAEAYAPRTDAAMLARFRVHDGDRRPLDVAQVWRRDSRAQRDVVATWTSIDGRWPVPLERGIPRAGASR